VESKITFGKVITLARLQICLDRGEDLNKKQIAEMIGISKSLLSQLETGWRSRPSQDTVDKMEKVFPKKYVKMMRKVLKSDRPSSTIAGDEE
jgi:transcriptional regulator with XRE-family HTH domain